LVFIPVGDEGFETFVSILCKAVLEFPIVIREVVKAFLLGNFIQGLLDVAFALKAVLQRLSLLFADAVIEPAHGTAVSNIPHLVSSEVAVFVERLQLLYTDFYVISQ